MVIQRVVYFTLTVCVVLQLVTARKRDSDFETELKSARQEAEAEENQRRNIDKQRRQDGVDYAGLRSTDDFLDLFSAPAKEVAALAEKASLQLRILKRLTKLKHINPHMLKANKKYLRIWKRNFAAYCPQEYKGKRCNRRALYRTATGACNNLRRPAWGSTFSPELREIPPMYDDGVDSPRQRDRLGLPLPCVRTISNKLFSVKGKSPRTDRLTVMVMQWGQFIDHEFVATPTLKGENGTNIQCCGKENENREQCFPIHINDKDPYFDEECMNFVRSAPAFDMKCNPGFREQINQVTSYIDGSTVYGSTLKATSALRTMSKGQLKSRNNEGNMLPKDTDDKCAGDKPDSCQKAGDARVNVVPSLGVSHTTFFRAHNIFAQKLAGINPHWNDETLFQETRRIIAAILQHITYNEYLPSILNSDIMKKYALNVQPGYSNCYNRKINPTVSNVFAVASFRFGHSQIPDYQAVMSKSYRVEEKLSIQSCYHNPHLTLVNKGGNMDGIARWLVDDPCPKADHLFEKGTRNELFLDKKGKSLDLPALNLQRGRDHGTPSYNYWRIHCGLERAEMSDSGSFILPDHTTELSKKLSDLYRHVDDIDLFAGAMTEKLLPDSSMGPTFACLNAKQFMRLKNGDRFWYETRKRRIRFTKDQLKEIKKVSLAGILCECYDMDTIQKDVFYTPSRNNERVNCLEIPSINLNMWTASPKRSRRKGRPVFY